MQGAFPGAAGPALVAVKANTASPAFKTAVRELRTRALASGEMQQPIRIDVNAEQTGARIQIPLIGSGVDAASNRALQCPMVLGNADAFLLAVPSDSPEPISERQLEVREWTLSRLDETYLNLIRSFQPTVGLEHGGTSMLFFHGSPRSYDDVLVPGLASASLEPFRGHDVDLLAGGHTHKQWARGIDGALFVNPGSVGLAYDHHQKDDEFMFRPVAEYALVIVDDLGLAVEFRQVPYSSADMQAAAKANGHPYAGEWASEWAER